MSAYERNKGIRIEREIVNLHKQAGIDAERVPLSGASRYQGNGSDLDIYPSGRAAGALKAEVKGRASGAGFTMLERWLGKYDVLFLRRDRQDPLVVVPWQTWIALLENQGRGAATTSIRPMPKNGQDGATCERPEPRKGDGNEHSASS
jgi:hypothetical protein